MLQQLDIDGASFVVGETLWQERQRSFVDSNLQRHVLVTQSLAKPPKAIWTGRGSPSMPCDKTGSLELLNSCGRQEVVLNVESNVQGQNIREGSVDLLQFF